jgi:hypothetical protein
MQAAPTEKVASTTQPAPPRNKEAKTPDKPTVPKQKGTLIRDLHTTCSSESSTSVDRHTLDEQFVRCILQCIGFNWDCRSV